MSWRTIRTGFLIGLIILNIVLFWATRVVRDQRYTAKEENMERILELYKENGISIQCILNREGYPKPLYRMGEASLFNRQMIERFLGSEYQTAYMTARQSRYTTDTAMLRLDPDNHLLTLQSSGEPLRWQSRNLMSIAQSWVERTVGSEWVCTEYQVDEALAEFIFTQYTNGLYLYFNHMIVRLHPDGTLRIFLQYYEPEGFEAGAQEIRPLDELMYGAMKTILQRCAPENRVVEELRYGYDSNDRSESAYCLEFVLAGGRTVRVNAFTNEVLNPNG
ncbi:MAG: hypothetical protein IJM90_01125 [Firmicutes bacterium]|nr:hypothetical protein [Bacillota bacterium]